MAKYPNVRPGAHALITVTEEHSQKRHIGRMVTRTNVPMPTASTVDRKPGVDVGVLLELVGDCGGHLWMTAEPSGNMVLKIHLPQRVSDGLAEPQAPSPRTVEERPTERADGTLVRALTSRAAPVRQTSGEESAGALHVPTVAIPEPRYQVLLFNPRSDHQQAD